MCVVGPSESGKTKLIYDMLRIGTFHPAFQKVIYFYKHWQPIYDEFSKLYGRDIEFIQLVDTSTFELVNQILERNNDTTTAANNSTKTHDI